MPKRKDPIIAAFLSMLIPGAGQIFNKQKGKAVIGYSAFLLFPIVFVMLRLGNTFWGLMSLPLFLVTIYLINIIDACVSAIKSREKKFARIRLWQIVIPFGFLFIDVCGAIHHVRHPDHSAIGFQAIHLATNSMAPTMQVGDFFIVSTKNRQTPGIARGGIIHFFHHGLKAPLFKRLIAMSGDTVEVKEQEVYVNGRKLHEPYAQYVGNSRQNDFNQRHTTDEFGPICVPGNMLFVLGDNRDNSFDSRDPEFGFVDIKDVYPNLKPLYIYWSMDKSRIGKKIE